MTLPTFDTEKYHAIAARLFNLVPEQQDRFLQSLEANHIDFWNFPIMALPSATEVAPLSPLQLGLFQAQQLQRDHIADNLFYGLTFQGAFSPAILEKALASIVTRHQILRTQFLSMETGPKMQVLEAYQAPIRLVDLSGLCGDRASKLLQELARNEVAAPFEFEKAPAYRIALIKENPDQYHLFFTIHHIIFDAWSVNPFTRELAHFYRAMVTNGAGLLPPLPIQYSDYAAWSSLFARQPKFQKSLAYWQKQLADLPLGFKAPSDHGVYSEVHHMAIVASDTVPEALAAQVSLYCRQQNITLFSFFISCYAVLLHRLSGSEDFAIGTSIANRNRQETQDLIGFLVNVLVIRIKTSGNPSFLEFLAKVKDTVYAAFENQEVPYSSILQMLKPSERGQQRAPLFKAFFFLDQNIITSRVGALTPGLQTKPFPQPAGPGRYPINFRVSTDGETTIRLLLELNLPQHLNGLPNQLLHMFLEILRHAVGDASRLLSSIQLDTGPLASWRQQGHHEPAQTVHQRFFEWAQKAPHAPALITLEETLSYAQVADKVRALARHLRQKGVGLETRVGLILPRSSLQIMSVLAVLKAGGTYVPIDPHAPPKAQRQQVVESECRILLCLEEKVAWAPPDTDILHPDKLLLTPPPCSDTFPHVFPDCLAYIIFTSGSTGMPKQVGISHGALDHYVTNLLKRHPVPENASFSTLSSLATDLGNTAIFGALMSGRPLLIPPVGAETDDLRLRRFFKRQPPYTLKIVPSHLRGFLAGDAPEDLLPTGLLILGGEALSPTLIDTIQKLRPHLTLVNHYGPTEATIGCCSYTIDTAAAKTMTRIPIGLPFNHSEAHLLNAWSQPVPPGFSGTLFLAGQSLARGYLNNPRATAQAFLPNPFTQREGGRMYACKDEAFFDPIAGLVFLGRTDDQVKVRGFRVELGMIEAALRNLTFIKEAVASLYVPASGSQQIVAYIQWQSGAMPWDTVLKELSQHLPDYALPQNFVEISQFPRLPNGKINRRGLPAPNQPTAKEIQKPRNPIEATLWELWKKHLGREDFGIHANFFELGGDSIIGLLMVASARKENLKFLPDQLFQFPTIANLAQVVEPFTTAKTTLPAATAGFPLLPIQHWFFNKITRGRHHWNQTLFFSTAHSLDPNILQKAVFQLVQRHEVLCYRFSQEADFRWTQHLEKVAIGESFLFHDLSAIEDEFQRREQLMHMTAQIQASLSLEKGPLFVVAFFAMGPMEPSRLLLTAHHLIIDGVSWRILTQELPALYLAIETSQPVDLPPIPTTYSQWSHQVHHYAKHANLTSERAYWQDHVPTSFSRLVPCFPAGQNTYADASTQTIILAKSLTKTLLHTTPKVFRTQTIEVLLTAIVAALSSELSSSVLLELEGHGREVLDEATDLTSTVGWFTTRFPLLFQGADEDVEALIPLVKARWRSLPRRGLLFGVLRYLANPPLEVHQDPDISVNYLGQYQRSHSGWLEAANEDPGLARHPECTRPHLWEINAQVIDQEFHIQLSFSKAQFQVERIARVLKRIQGALERLGTLSLTPNISAIEPHDFPLARLTKPEMLKLFAPQQWASIQDLYPLSPLQQGILFHELIESEMQIFLNQMSCRLHGPIDSNLFQKTWEMLIQRHTILRTSFHWGKLSHPLQAVHFHSQLVLNIHDLTHQNPANQAHIIQQFLIDDKKNPFQFTLPPLMRLTLFKLGPTEFHLVWSRHHLLLDGWSTSLLMSEFFKIYQTLRRAEDPNLPVAHPFRNYVAWLQAQDPHQAAAFWQEQLKDFEEPTPLPGAGHLDQNRGFVVETAQLSEKESEALRKMAASAQVTLNTVLKAAWAILLAHYSGKKDVLFGTTVSGRPPSLENADQIIGLFINNQPLRVRMNFNSTLVDFLQQIQRQEVTARQYEFYPLVEVRRHADLPAGTPLFHSLMVFENLPMPEFESAKNPKKPEIVFGNTEHREFTNFPLTLTVLPGKSLKVKLSFRQHELNPSILHQVRGYLETLLRNMATSRNLKLGDIDLFSEAALKAMVIDWNNTAAPYPEDGCIHTLFQQQVKVTPDRVCVEQDGVRESETLRFPSNLTYAELDARANQLARYLRRLGIGPDKTVAVYLHRSSAIPIALMAVLKSGGAYVPLDPIYPMERQRYMAQDAGVHALITQSEIAQNLGDLGVPVIMLDAPGPQDLESTGQLENHTLPDHLAYMMYTSGSTGRPKGVTITHRNAVALLHWLQKPIDPQTMHCVLAATSFCFDISLTELFMPLLFGCKMLMVENVLYLARENRRQDITLVNTVPSAMEALLAQHDLPPSVRKVIFVGEPLRRRLVEKVYAKSCVTEVFNLYGPTEDTVYATQALIAPNAKGEPSIGVPLDNRYNHILNDRGLPVPIGAHGEIHLGGAGVVRGYHRQPGTTAEKFVPNPFPRIPGDRLYKTGDFGYYLPDGNAMFVGRKDQELKVRGFRINLGEIESVMAEHPHVHQAAVVVRSTPTGDRQLHGYFQPLADLQPGKDVKTSLIEFLQRKLPEYMNPSILIQLEVFPLLPNGKLDTKKLPIPNFTQQSQEHREPRTPREWQVRHIFEELLGVTPISTTDNFFLLGGNSLLAVSLMARINEVMNANLSLSSIYERPTVAQISQATQTTTNQFTSLTEIQAKGNKPPLFLIHPIRGHVFSYIPLAELLGPDQPVYGLVAQGLEEGQHPMTRIESMAEAYCREIAQFYPTGPIVLGGWSMGATVAFEMTRILLQMGRDVESTILIDHYPRVLKNSMPSDGELVKRFASGLTLPLPTDLEWDQPDPHIMLEKIFQMAMDAKVLPPGVHLKQLIRLFQVYRAHVVALHHYQPLPLAAPFVLLYAQDSEFQPDCQNLNHLTPNLTLHALAGNHSTLFNKEHVAELANLMCQLTATKTLQQSKDLSDKDPS